MGSEPPGSQPNNSNPNPPPMSPPYSPTESAESDLDQYQADLRDLVYSIVFPNPHEWFLITVYAVIFITGLVGNILVCFAVLKNEHMRTVTNYYIVNMAVADVLVVLLCLAPNVMVDTTETWFFGEMACHILPYLQEVSLSVSIYTLAAIAVDRYLAICRPLKFHIRASRTLFIVAAIWVLSFSIMAPQAVFLGLEAQHGMEFIGKPVWMTRCFEKGWFGSTWQRVYHIAKVIVTYICPLVLMGVAYALVCRRLWSGIPTDETRKSDGGRGKQVTMNKSTENQLESRRKVARMLIVVVVLFAICNLPTHLLNVIKYMDGFKGGVAAGDPDDMKQEGITVAFVIAHFMMYFNNAINPIIYNFLSARFRKEFQRAFSCCPCVSVPDRRKRPGSASYHRCRDFAARSGNNGVCSQTDYRSHDHNTEYLQLSKLGKTNGTNNNSTVVVRVGSPNV